MAKKKGKRKKKKTLKRKDRLKVAQSWIMNYEGKNFVRGYRKRFSVDIPCAVKELEMLGYEIDPEYKKRLKQSVEDSRKAREAKKKQKEEEREGLEFMDSDETFYFIAGYTPGGAPYGITWEEYESERNNDGLKDTYNKAEFEECLEYDDDEIPF